MCPRRQRRPAANAGQLVEALCDGLSPTDANAVLKRLLQVLDDALDKQGNGAKLVRQAYAVKNTSDLNSKATAVLHGLGFAAISSKGSSGRNVAGASPGGLTLPVGSELQPLRDARELIDVLVISYAEDARQEELGVTSTSAVSGSNHPVDSVGQAGTDDAEDASQLRSNPMTPPQPPSGATGARAVHGASGGLPGPTGDASGACATAGGSSAASTTASTSPGEGRGSSDGGNNSEEEQRGSAGAESSPERSGNPSPGPNMEDRDRMLAERLAREEQPKVVEFQRFRSENIIVDPSVVDEINRACAETGEKYTDPQFPPTTKSLYLTDWEVTQWECPCCLTRNPLPPVPPLPKTREEAKQQEEIFKAQTICNGCGENAPYVVQVRCFTRPTQWLRPGSKCDGCELVYGSLPGGRDMVPQMCTHFIRDSISHITVGSPWKLIREAARPEDVCQGGLGNCWFAGALSVVAQMPHLIDRLFVTKEINEWGVYYVQLCHAGLWRGMVLDDSFPTSQIFEGYLEGQMMYYSRGGHMTFLQGARRQLWVPLVEKAAAKLFGCYGSLKGGTFGEAMAMLTGYPTQRIRLYVPKAIREARAKRRKQREMQRRLRPHLPSEDTESDEDEDLMWTRLESCKNAGYLMGMGCTEEGCEKTKQHIVEEKGLQAPHAYGILDVREAKTANGEVVRLVKIRNPWGERAPRTWKGDWGKDSPLWTPELQRELGVINSSGVQMDDPMSIFWMAFKDVKEYFAQVEVCRVHTGWHETRQRAWLPSACGPGQAFDLTVFKTTEVDLVVWQEKHISREGALGARSTNVDVGLAVLRACVGKSPEGQVEYDLVEYMERASSDDVSRELVLEGGYVYRLVPLCYGQILEPAPRCAVIAVHSVHPVELTKVESTWRDVACATFEGTKKHGKEWTERSNPGVTCWLLHEPAGCSFVVENQSSKPAAMQLDASDSVGCVCSRGCPGCVALIPPRSWQVMLVLAHSANATHTRVSLMPQLVPVELASEAEASDGVHTGFKWPLPGARKKPSPSEAIRNRAPPEQQPSSQPQRGAVSSGVAGSSGCRGGGSSSSGSAPGSTREPHVVALDAPQAIGEDVDDDLEAALRLSLECTAAAPTVGSASSMPVTPPVASTGSFLGGIFGSNPNSNAAAAAPQQEAVQAPIGESDRAQLQAKAKELFTFYRAQGMAPNEAAARAGEEARRRLGAAR